MTPQEKIEAARSEKVFDLLRSLQTGEVSIQQYRAQMRDMKFEEWQIDLYLDGDTTYGED